MIDYSVLGIPKGSRVLDKDAKDAELARAERECRLAVFKRDGRLCRVPNCREKSAHNHHIVYRSHGGEWDSANICRLCVRHHQLVHSGHLRISGDADDVLTFEGVK